MLRVTKKFPFRAPVVRSSRSASSQASSSAIPTSTPSHKYPTRGGQNISSRFQRLENSIRGKRAYQNDIAEIAGDRTENDASPGKPVRLARPKVNTFMGFVVPEEPKPPGPDECCMSGCAVCVQDLYAEALDEYNATVKSLRASLSGLNVPEDTWPPSIRPSSSINKPATKQNIALDAFAELERQLQMKKEAASQGGASIPPLNAQAPRRRKKPLVDIALLYEGVRWVIFSNR